MRYRNILNCTRRKQKIMELNNEQEFLFSFVWIGGLVLAGTIVTITLTAFGILVYKRLKDKKIIKKLYEQERKNGRAGSRGNF